MSLATDLSALRAAGAIIHRDREWWRKLVIGATLSLTIVGYPIVEGFQLESIENTQNRFPTPLPRWNALANKAIVGLLAVVIDVFFFFFPLLCIGLLLLCAGFAAVLAGIGGPQLGLLGFVASGLGLGWLMLAWLSSVSPVAKWRFVADGQLETILSSRVVRDVWRQPARNFYLQARLRSFPVYLLPLALLGTAWYSTAWSRWIALLLVWISCAAWLYARLVVVQLYAAATREIQQHEFEALQARLRA